MEYLIPSFIAGVLTILAPCSVTLLPVMLSGSAGERNPWKPLIVAVSLGVSIFVFTLLLKVFVDFIGVDDLWLRIFSGVLLFFLGLTMTFPAIWDNIQVKLGLYKSETLLTKSDERGGFLGAILLGASLGPVFSTCSPTYFYIVGTVLPINFWVGLVNLLVYSLGLVLMLLVIGYGGRAVVQRLKFATNPNGLFKKILGVILVVVGLSVLTGFDKTVESFILDLINRK